MTIATAAKLILAGAIGLSALGPQQPKAGPSSSPLGGPSVRGEVRPTLVERDFNGRLQRLVKHPAEAALPLLELDAGARARVGKILSERAAILDQTVRDNFDLLINMVSAGDAKDPDVVRIGILFVQKLKPLIARGGLEAEIGKVLPPDQRARLSQLVGEYFDAVAAEEGKPRYQALPGETLRLWGEQIRLSFERQAKDGVLFLELVIKDIKLRPEQEERVRDRYQRFVDETQGAPTKQQEASLAIDIMAWLDVAQQKALLRKFMELDGKRPRPAPAKTEQPEAEAMMSGESARP